MVLAFKPPLTYFPPFSSPHLPPHSTPSWPLHHSNSTYNPNTCLSPLPIYAHSKWPTNTHSFAIWYRYSSSEEEDDDHSFDEAVSLFNQREYYKCHDLLEALWNKAEDPTRTLIHGILQCAVGFHHLFNQVGTQISHHHHHVFILILTSTSVWGSYDGNLSYICRTIKGLWWS